MKKAGYVLTLAIVLLFCGQSGRAAVREWQLDPPHTGFYFTANHMFAKIRGSFLDFSGTVLFDPADLALSRMKFVIEVDSIDTHVAKRDRDLLAPEFFDEATYPEIVFESTSITQTGKNDYAVTGKFTIKGRTHDLVLPLALAGIKEHPAQKDKLVVGFTGTIVLDRLAYGIGTGSVAELALLGREVEVLVSFEALSDK